MSHVVGAEVPQRSCLLFTLLLSSWLVVFLLQPSYNWCELDRGHLDGFAVFSLDVRQLDSAGREPGDSKKREQE